MGVFDTMLAAAYQALGTSATHTGVASGVQTPVRVRFMAGGGDVSLDGLLVGDAPSITLPTAALPERRVRRGDGFLINGVAYRAREAGAPQGDGSELLVPLAKA